MIMDYLLQVLLQVRDDGSGMQGVAPSASLHLSDLQIKIQKQILQHTGQALQMQQPQQSYVQNNSWGASNSTIATVNTYKTNNSVDKFMVLRKNSLSGLYCRCSFSYCLYYSSK